MKYCCKECGRYADSAEECCGKTMVECTDEKDTASQPTSCGSCGCCGQSEQNLKEV